MRFGALEEGVSNQARQKERADAEGGEARTRGPDCASGAVRVCRWARDRTVSDGSSLALVSPRAGVLTGVMEPGEDAGRTDIFPSFPTSILVCSCVRTSGLQLPAFAKCITMSENVSPQAAHL